MEYDNLSQNVNARHHYHEDKYNIYFFHDFSKYKSLEKQYDAVKQKYDRRINRFLQSIQYPTLFIRYISSEDLDEKNRSVELNWIEENHDAIMSVLRKFNPENNIAFIGDETVHSDIIHIFNVKKDDGDKVSRLPIFNNKELYSLLSSVDFHGKEENIERYKRKQKRRHLCQPV